MRIIPISNPKREHDSWGDGHFAASRGGRPHMGRDYEFAIGEAVRCPVAGTVGRLGYPYAGNAEYRLIEVLTHNRKMLWRFFYVRPAVRAGDVLEAGDTIGVAQDIQKKYDRKMTNHVHVECIVDPEFFFDGRAEIVDRQEA